MAKFDIIAATGCPTGIAHTFMAKEALEKAAAERGLTIKVETHGQVGVENELTKSEIAGAKAVVVAADKDVQAERFAGKPMVSVGVSKALSVEAAGKLIDRALAAKGDDTLAAAADVEDEVEEKESIGHVIYKHLMNGVSHMLPFVIGGGILTGGRLLEGSRGLGGELGHYRTHALDGVPCTCGAVGCWERYAATTALVRAAKEKNPDWKDGRAIFAAAEAGDETVLALLDAWIDEIAQGLAGMVHIFNPQLILIGGGVSAQQKLLIDPIAAKVRASVMPAFAEGLEIRAAQLHNDAGMVGAIYYFRQTMEKE